MFNPAPWNDAKILVNENFCQILIHSLYYPDLAPTYKNHLSGQKYTSREVHMKLVSIKTQKNFVTKRYKNCTER